MINIIAIHWSHAEMVDSITNAPNVGIFVLRYTLTMKRVSQLPMTVVAVKGLIVVANIILQISILNNLKKMI